MSDITFFPLASKCEIKTYYLWIMDTYGLGRTGWSKSGKQTTDSNGLTSQFIYNVTLRVSKPRS